jgi:periplasmic protein TonB
MRHGRQVFATALVLSFAAHAAGAYLLGRDRERPEIEGAPGSGDVALGASFADLAAGVANPLEATDETEIAAAPAVQSALPLEPAPTLVAVSPPPAAAPMAEPDAATTPGSATAAVSEPAEVAPALPPAVETAPIAALPVDAPRVAADAALPATDPEEPATAEEPPAQVSPNVGAPVEAPALENDEHAESEANLRPRRRPADLAPARPPEPERVEAPLAETNRRSSPGNAQQDATRGSVRGQADRQGASATSGRSPESTEQGDAAASNYPGQIMARLYRSQRVSVSARGIAVVAFSVAEDGALASAGIARSSGSPPLDQAAVQIVRSAAPFPAPPPGARRSFTVQIRGR